MRAGTSTSWSLRTPARIANGLREVTAEPQDAPPRIANGLREMMVEGDRAAPEVEEVPGGQNDSQAPAVAEQPAPQASQVHSGRSDDVKLRIRGKLEERCSDGTFDSMFMEAMRPAAEDPPETSRGPLPAEPPALDLPSPPPEDVSVVQRELQGMRGDNNGLREQINLMMQKMEKLRLENEALNDRLDGNLLV